MQLRKQWKQLTNEGLLSFKFKNQFSYNIIFCVKIYWREGNWCEKSSYWSRIGYQSVSNKLTLSNCSSIGLMHYLLFGFSLTIHDTGPFLVIPSWVLFNLYANNMEMLVFLFSLISATLIFFLLFVWKCSYFDLGILQLVTEMAKFGCSFQVDKHLRTSQLTTELLCCRFCDIIRHWNHMKVIDY